jgi:SAM-dependent methyltransferase
MKTFKTNEQILRYESVLCPVCGRDDFHELFHVTQRTIVECNNCSHEYVNPAPIFASKDNYYFPSLEMDALNTKIDMAYIAKIVKKYQLTNSKLLDLGCGQGRLTQGLIQAGWHPGNLYLMDRSKAALDTAKERYNAVNIIEQDINEGTGFANYFDCVIMVEFLEDLVYPGKALERALDALKPGGIIIIRGLPNNKSLESFIAGENWKMRVFEKHYSFYNPDTFGIFSNHFPNMEILEFGTFLQRGNRFFNLSRIGKNIGLIKRIIRYDQYEKNNGEIIDTKELTRSILEKLKSANINDYCYCQRLPVQQLANLSNAEDIESFFDEMNLDYLLATDFSVIARRCENND